MNGRMDEWMRDRWMDGWMDGGMSGWMDGWMDVRKVYRLHLRKQKWLGKSVLICRVGFGHCPRDHNQPEALSQSLKKEVVVGIASESRGRRVATPSGQERTTSGGGKDS